MKACLILSRACAQAYSISPGALSGAVCASRWRASKLFPNLVSLFPNRVEACDGSLESCIYTSPNLVEACCGPLEGRVDWLKLVLAFWDPNYHFLLNRCYLLFLLARFLRAALKLSGGCRGGLLNLAPCASRLCAASLWS